jgi:hypothetical protein
MTDEKDNQNTTPDKPATPQFPIDRVELNEIPIQPTFPADRIEKGEKPRDISKKDN